MPEPPDPLLPSGEWFAELLHKNAKGQVIYYGKSRWLLNGHAPFISAYNPSDSDSAYYTYLLSSLHNVASIQYYNGLKKWQPVQY